MSNATINIDQATCHDECQEIHLIDQGQMIGSVEFNVSDITGWKYIECNICQTHPVAHSTFVNSGHDADDWTHPTIEDAILHAWSHAS